VGGSESTVNVTQLRVRVLMYLSRARATELSRLDGAHSYTKAASVGVGVKTRGPCGLPFARERYIKLVTLTLRRRSGRGVQTG